MNKILIIYIKDGQKNWKIITCGETIKKEKEMWTPLFFAIYLGRNMQMQWLLNPLFHLIRCYNTWFCFLNSGNIKSLLDLLVNSKNNYANGKSRGFNKEKVERNFLSFFIVFSYPLVLKVDNFMPLFSRLVNFSFLYFWSRYKKFKVAHTKLYILKTLNKKIYIFFILCKHHLKYNTKRSLKRTLICDRLCEYILATMFMPSNIYYYY